MGIFLATVCIVLLGILFAVLERHSDVLSVMGALFISLGGAAVLISGLLAIALPGNTDFAKRYEKVLSHIDVANNADTLNVKFVHDLEEDIKSVNRDIAANREYEGTFWLGWYYSSEIGDYEYLAIPDFNVIKFDY